MYTTNQKVNNGVNKFEQKSILAFNRSKVTVKTFTLQIMSNEYCFFELSIHQRNL